MRQQEGDGENMEKSKRSIIPVTKIEDDGYDWFARHEKKCREAASGKFDIVFIGDSLTHYWMGDSHVDYGSAVWNEYYGKRKVLNLGFGYDRTQNVLWRLEHGEMDGQNPKLIVLNIGTNQFSETPNYPMDTPEDAVTGIRTVVEKLQTMFPETFFILMALFPRGEAGSVRARMTKEANRLLKPFAETRERLLYLDLGEALGEKDHSVRPELYNPCRTHLNEKGYRIWAEALEPHIRRILGGK